MAYRYNVQFHDDGTYISVPSTISITPGTSFFIQGEAKQAYGGVFNPIDLTDCTLIAALIDSSGMIRVYQTDSPAIKITNAEKGRFSLNLAPQLTQVLVSGDSHILEIKCVKSNGEKRQIAYTPITISDTALRSE